MRQRPEAFGTRGMVASAHPVAAFIGLTILQRGGNAFDAALAVAAAEGVVLPMKCGLGGDAFVVLHDAKKREMVAFNGSGVAGGARNGGLLPEPRPQEHAVEGRSFGQRAGRRERLRGVLEALLHHAMGGALGARHTPRGGRARDHGLHQRALRGRGGNAGALSVFRRAVSAEGTRSRGRRALGGAQPRADAEGGRAGRRGSVLSRRDRREDARVSEGGGRARSRRTISLSSRRSSTARSRAITVA